MKYEGNVIDSHLHMQGGYGNEIELLEGMEKLTSFSGCVKKNVAMVPQWDPEFASQNALGILYKAFYPETNYVYAGLDYYMPKGKQAKDFLSQAKQYMDMGFDGIKMVELKPMIQKKLGYPHVSDPVYDEMFSYMEEYKIPLLLHVGDPETFWSYETAPDFAIENGWVYADDSYIPLEKLYEDTEAMLKKHPRLPVSLAHFYFLSNQYERAVSVMENFPNVRFDLTPGIEMYGNFSKCPENWRHFFQRYEDRILFGTDNGWGSATPIEEKLQFASDNVAVIHRFLETADHFTGYGMELKGLDLPVHTLEKIYYSNYEVMAGTQPKKADAGKALEYVEEMLTIYRGEDIPFYDRVVPQLESVIRLLKGKMGK